MRTIIDIPDTQIKILDKLTSQKSVSRAQIIRDAINFYIANQNKNKKAFEESFGVWKNKKINSIKYVQEIRNEWRD